ncbi:phosphopantothenoylcysteine decarboxylase [Zalerion maritima]|uniref:Phosphopantothenoylcysteine decarboxylase n=1 Tax=Zalerion maritima TaxID=339359 RepID=A0AAD5S1I2_9PEZI|nr:phosphopantothenoylcysteine decarboxylase [Zalerion maritima]
MIEMPRMRKLHLLIASNGPKDIAYAEALAVRVSRDASIEVRAIVDEVPHRLSQEIAVLQNRSLIPKTTEKSEHDALEFYRRQAFELVEWADLLVLAPIDADNLAKMLAGVADTFFLEVLRGWNTSKRIILVPGMSTHMWEHPITKRHLSKINRKWNWVRIWEDPILWKYSESYPKRIIKWDGFKTLINIIKNNADVLLMGQDIDPEHPTDFFETVRDAHSLPVELWLTILEYSGDWEMAQALGFREANIKRPAEWTLAPANTLDPICVYLHELEWALLSGSLKEIYNKLSEAPPNLADISPRAVKLIMKFDLTSVLTYLEINKHTLFWNTFSGKTLPTKASVSWARPSILEWWKKSPSFLEKHYDHEAMNGASMLGHIQVLEWWRRSGLPLNYTDAALEQATIKGQLSVLEWWRDSAMQDDRIILKPGKSLGLAAQYGNWQAIQWWDASGIPVALGDRVCKIASAYGQVEVLDMWRKLKGENMPYDYRVLNEPTKKGLINVLEWWKKFARGQLPGLDGRTHKVQYKTCDIEEALEDSIGDQKEVRRWWAENGLNLGLRTNEWMKTRSL